MQDLISIIVPVYKTEQHLPKCLNSILAQTYKHLEIILVDDGSPDNSGQICDEYAVKDGRIKVVHQPNSGVNIARKNGFLHSTGEWIMFVDSDDAFISNAVEVLLSNADNADIVSGTVAIYRGNSTIPESFPEHIKEIGEYDGAEFIKQLCNASRLCSLWRQLIKRSILSEEILSVSPKIKFSEDFIINLRMGMNVKYVKGIPDTVYQYYYYQGNAVTSFQMTSDYLDAYYTELQKGISESQKQTYAQLLYSYQLNKVSDYIGICNIHKTQMASYLRSERKGKLLSLRQRYNLLLLYIPSCRLRKNFKCLYGTLTTLYTKLKNHGHSK